MIRALSDFAADFRAVTLREWFEMTAQVVCLAVILAAFSLIAVGLAPG